MGRAMLLACALTGMAWPIMSGTSVAGGDRPSTEASFWEREGRFGGALEFTGKNCIEVHDLGKFREVTISMWLRVGARPENELSLLSTDDWNESALHLLLTEQRRILVTVNGNEPLEDHSRARVGRRVGSWSHLAVILDHRNRRWKIFLDGKLDCTTRLEEVVPVDLDDFRIGAWNEEPRCFVGWMDDIRVYGRALDASEVAALAAGAEPKRASVAWWPLDEERGVQAKDHSGSGHHGRIREVGEFEDEERNHDKHDEDEERTADWAPPVVEPRDRIASLRWAIDHLAEEFPDYEKKAGGYRARLDGLKGRPGTGPRALSDSAARDAMEAELDGLQYEALVRANPLFDLSKLLFIKRCTFQSSHFYTDFIDGCVDYGGNLCVLDLKTGEVTELIPEMNAGIFGRFDLHFSATKIVFDWKAGPSQGFRIYEIDVDPERGIRMGGPRQLTHPPEDEQERIDKYAHPDDSPGPGRYYHQTDDMHPCYLPDGGIAFASTRCEYGTLCDAADILSTAVIYRMDGDGSNMEKLTNSPLSEFCPTMMADGRVLYTRWEYVDKGQIGVKCLWSMRPDGTGTAEIYGNDIPFPPSFMYGRQIPGYHQMFVFVGAPHFPQGGSFGTILRIDTRRDIRTRQPMTYVTPHVDIRQEEGWNQWRNGRWVRDERGPLYTDPYPLSKDFFLVSSNPYKRWNHVRAYGLYLLDTQGNRQLLYRDEDFTCREPYPLRPRETPPVLVSDRDMDLAEQNLAVCTVAEVHQGMEGIEPGEVKYLRIMEQLPRPWDARRFWDPHCRFDEHTHLISEGTALGGKVMWGVVPVEEDGSACFYVPADRNIYFQALDENYMELQRERTYVNYRPGERRSCVGCHERPNEVIRTGGRGDFAAPLAMARPPSMPEPQPGDERPRQVLHYPTYVQPVLDEFCVRCHGETRPKAGLDLTGELTTHFSRSYENIMERGLVKTFREASDFGGTRYCPPKTIGSHASEFISRVQNGCTGMEEPLPQWAFVRLATWVDASGIYYGSYWGRRHIRFKGHAFFRPVPTFEQALSTTCPVPKRQR